MELADNIEAISALLITGLAGEKSPLQNTLIVVLLIVEDQEEGPAVACQQREMPRLRARAQQGGYHALKRTDMETPNILMLHSLSFCFPSLKLSHGFRNSMRKMEKILLKQKLDHFQAV